ncbi:MAG: hypothetical protein FJX52_06585 [Alphaproteobacteria bacterium]|nr:hypothetical protein [Alphaproteobacteria bacterium]
MTAAAIDQQRRARGFLSIAETLALAERGNDVLDPYAVLISAVAAIGGGNRFYPGVVIEAQPGGSIKIGTGNVFWPNSTVVAAAGQIVIGSGNQFGPGGFSAYLDRPDGKIVIGAAGCYRDGAVIFAGCVLGDGAQILGPIQAQDCTLTGGGGFAHPDPDGRGAVLKGVGRARGLTLGRGEVIEGHGAFAAADIEMQSVNHPRAPSELACAP